MIKDKFSISNIAMIMCNFLSGFTIKDVTQLKSSTLTAIALDFNKVYHS